MHLTSLNHTLQSPFYSLPTGNHSGYNDHSTECLKSLHACGGKYDKKAYVQHLKSFYGPADCEYQVSYIKRKKQQDYIAENKLQWTEPIEGMRTAYTVGIHLQSNLECWLLNSGHNEAIT